jgi:hypothetical protein
MVIALLLLRRRAARHVVVAVEWVVAVVEGPCLSQRRNFVVWTRRMMMTSNLVRRPRYCPQFGGDVSIHGRDVYCLAFLWMEYALSWRECV